MAKRSAALALTVALAAALAGCATPTPYQPNIPGQQTSGGYSEVRIVLMMLSSVALHIGRKSI